MNMDAESERINIQIASGKAVQDGWLVAFATEDGTMPAGEILRQRTQHPEGLAEERLLIGLGAPPDYSTQALRKAGRNLAEWARRRAVHDRLVIPVGPALLQAGQPGIQAICEGLHLGAFRLGAHQTRQSEPQTRLEVTLAWEDPKLETTLSGTVDRARAIAAGVNLTRDWAHEPPNLLNPETLGVRSRLLAESAGLGFRLLAESELVEMGAGALVAVGKASPTPSRLIILEYPGSDQAQSKRQPPVALVGKAITFDTGGYTIKTRAGLVGMKFDKCGGLTILGAMQAIAALQPETPVVGIVPAAENMISSRAYRPNDIVTTLSGQTVEIISTDAEGRLILADALSYAAQAYRPAAVLDVATLTSGIVTALGKVRAGLMANDDALADALLRAGERTGELLWRMPLDAEYLQLLWSPDADFRNSTLKSQAHPVVGGIFLKQFVPEKLPWAHLDIAGTATVKPVSDYNEERATGFGVRLLVDFIEKFGQIS